MTPTRYGLRSIRRIVSNLAAMACQTGCLFTTQSPQSPSRFRRTGFRTFAVSAGALILSLVPDGSHAALEQNGNVIRDTETGLEWLRLTLTKGMSVNQAVTQFGGEGFRIATSQEVSTLAEHGGTTTGGSWLEHSPGHFGYISSSNFNACSNFILLIGITNDSSFDRTAGGWTRTNSLLETGRFDVSVFDDPENSFASIGYSDTGVFHDESGNRYEQTDDSVSEFAGVWMVRGGMVGTPQSIEFTAPPTMYPGDLELSSTATSGLPVTFEVVSGPATIDGGTLTASDVGEVRVVARQPGDATYAAAAPVERTIRVLPALDLSAFGGNAVTRAGESIFNDTGHGQLIRDVISQDSWGSGERRFFGTRQGTGRSIYRFRTIEKMHPKMADSLTTYILELNHGNVTAALKAGVFYPELGEGQGLVFRVAYKYAAKYVKPRRKAIYPSIGGEILLRGESTTIPGDRDTTGLAIFAPPYRHNGSTPKQFRKYRAKVRSTNRIYQSRVAALGVRG